MITEPPPSIAGYLSTILNLGDDDRSGLESQLVDAILETDSCPIPVVFRREKFRANLSALWGWPQFSPERMQDALVGLKNRQARLSLQQHVGSKPTIDETSAKQGDDELVPFLTLLLRRPTAAEVLLLAVDPTAKHASRLRALAMLVVNEAQGRRVVSSELRRLVLNAQIREPDPHDSSVTLLIANAVLERAASYIPYFDGHVYESYRMVQKQIEVIEHMSFSHPAFRAVVLVPFYETAVTILVELGEGELAEKHLQNLELVAKGHARTHRVRARVLMHEGRSCDAIESLTQATNDEPLGRVRYAKLAYDTAHRSNCRHCQAVTFDLLRTELDRTRRIAQAG